MRHPDHRLTPRQPRLAGAARTVRRAAAFAAALLALDAAPASADHLASHCQDIVGGDTFLVGDSHTWLSGCGAAYPSWDVDALPGRASTEGLAVTTSSLRARHRRVVFDLATNDRRDPAALAANLRALWDVLGRDRSLLLVSSYAAPRDTGPVNTVLRDFVAAHPRRSDVAPWASYVREHPDVLSADGVHFTSAGYLARVAIVRTALRALPTPRARRGGTHAAPARPIKRKPVALLFHGGGFVAGEASIPDAETAARAQGFKPVTVDYELGNLRQAWGATKRAADSYGPKRQVVAYGESAGGALAARLAQKAQVSAATAYMPPTDLSNVANPTLTAMIQSLGASPEMIRRMSVARHRTRNPVLAQIARDDVLIDPAQTQAWAESDPRVRAQMVAGTHIYPPMPEQRAAQVQSAMSYLAGLATRAQL
jgi:acetyl esterase/lipase